MVIRALMPLRKLQRARQTKKKQYTAWPDGRLRLVHPRINLANNDIQSSEISDALAAVDSDVDAAGEAWLRYVKRRKAEFWENWDVTYGRTAVVRWGSRMMFRAANSRTGMAAPLASCRTRYVHLCMCVYIHVYTRMHYTYDCMSVCLSVCLYVRMYVCMYVCMYVMCECNVM